MRFLTTHRFGRTLLLFSLALISLVAADAPVDLTHDPFATTREIGRPAEAFETRRQPVSTVANAPLAPEPFVEAGTLSQATPQPDDGFGLKTAISSDGSVMAIAAPYYGRGTDIGVVSVFQRPAAGWGNTITPTAILTASNAKEFDRLGGSLAMSADGSTIVVGVPGRNQGAGDDLGQVVVFSRPVIGWVGTISESAVLTASDVLPDDSLGDAVAISADGTTIAASAPFQARPGATFTGAVYVFNRPGPSWAGSLTESAVLTVSNAFQGDRLGIALAITGDGAAIVAGTPYKFQPGMPFVGAIYVFNRPGPAWSGRVSESASLSLATGVAFDQFGQGIAISPDGTTIVGGAPGRAGPAGSAVGAAYVFSRPGLSWSGSLGPSATLIPTNGAANDAFGWSVGLAGDTVAIGIPERAGPTGPRTGAVSLFSKPGAGWSGTLTSTTVLTAAAGLTNGYLGSSVAFASGGRYLVAGAPGCGLPDYCDNTKVGSASLFRPAVPTTATVSASTAVASVGQSITLTAQISPPIGDLDLPSGPITFTSSSGLIVQVPLDGGLASLVTPLVAGSHVVTASYPGSRVFGASFATTRVTVTVPTVALGISLSGTDLIRSLARQRVGLGDPVVTYTLVVSNAGPAGVFGALVTTSLPIEDIHWSCQSTLGSSCNSASGAADLNATVSITAGGRLTYTLIGRVPLTATGDLIARAAILPPVGAVNTGTTTSVAIVTRVIDAVRRTFLPFATR